jgi:hypothetical protein
MNNNNLFIEIDYAQEKKKRREICGDSFTQKQIPEEGRRMLFFQTD